MTLVKQNFRNLNNIFDEFFAAPSNYNRELFGNNPPVNVHENEEGYHVEVVAPGLAKEDFKVQLEKGLLTISYEKKTENNTEDKTYKTHRREFSVSSFKRVFSVDEKIDADNIKAKYENGVLQLLLPKKEEVKVAPKAITIQ
jgi:HSP20 family protein